jgi:hypothetical protein
MPPKNAIAETVKKVTGITPGARPRGLARAGLFV